MKELILLFTTTLLTFNCYFGYAQKPEVIIRLEEDYTNPNGHFYQKSTEYVARSIEEGIYKAQANGSAINAELKFGLRIEQRNCFFENDAEFEILKTGKSKPADFIGIRFEIKEIKQNSDTSNANSNAYEYDLEYYWFYFNNEGKWKFMTGNADPTSEIQSGTTTMNPDKNTLKVEHLPKQTNLYLNGTKLAELKTTRMARLNWKDISITAESNKTKIGLDKAMFTGYYNKKNPPVLDSDVYGMNVRSFQYNDGLAVKPLNAKKYKYMDNWGRIPGNAEFDEANYSQNKSKMLWAVNDGKYGYINLQGNWAVQPIYAEAAKTECFEKDACITGYFKVKDAEGKEFLVNWEGKVVPLVNGKLATGNAAPAEKSSAKTENGFTALTMGKNTLNVYSNWLPHLHANGDNSASAKLDKKTIEVFGNGPKTWVNKESQMIFGGFSINIEEVESTYEKEKDNFITYYADAAASRWDAAKSDYKTPTEAEINKEKINIKPLTEAVEFKDGSTGKSLFYFAGIPYIGKVMKYIVVVPVAGNPKLVKKFTVEVRGETQARMEAADFKGWNDYFKTVLIK